MTSSRELYDFLNNLLYTTVQLRTLDDNGVGTCFFYQHDFEPGQSFPYLVTNKHVVEGCDIGEVTFHIGPLDEHNKPTEIWDFTIESLQHLCRYHPDADVDICIIPLLGILEEVQRRSGYHVYYQAFNSHTIPADEELIALLAIEDVYMIGYPTGLWDEENNFPLVRKGITASHPAYDFNQTSRGAIDIASFQGSSGSPIILYKVGGLSPDGSVSVGSIHFMLLGILESFAYTDVGGQVVRGNVPKAGWEVTSQVGIHIGYYIKAKELADVPNFLSFDEYHKDAEL